MTGVEDQLRALREHPPIGPESIEVIRAKARAWRRRRGRSRGGLLVVVAVIIGVSLLPVFSSDDEGGPRVVTPGSGGPSSLFVLEPNESGRSDLVELDAETRRVVRTIAPSIGWKGSALTSAGHIAVVSVVSADRRVCPDGLTRVGVWNLFQVNLEAGTSTPLGEGHAPVLSPDGQRLAFIRVGCTPAQLRLVVRDVASGREDQFALGFDGTDRDAFNGAVPIAWSRDGARLLLEYTQSGRVAVREVKRAFRYLDLSESDPVGNAPAFESLSVSRGPFDLLPLGTMGRWAAVVRSGDAQHPLRIVEYDPNRGRVIRTLVDQIPVHGQARNPSLTINLLSSDASGRRLLFSVFPRGGLYVWDRDQRALTRLATEVYAAGWSQPAARPSSITPPTDRAPEGWTIYRDETKGITAYLPVDWEPSPTDEHLLLSTAIPERVTFCDGVSTHAGFFTVNELLNRGSPPPFSPRPASFGPFIGTTETSSAVVVQGNCPDPPSLTQNIFFTDSGRLLQVMIRFYSEATPERRREAYEILNSMQIAPKE